MDVSRQQAVVTASVLKCQRAKPKFAHRPTSQDLFQPTVGKPLGQQRLAAMRDPRSQSHSLGSPPSAVSRGTTVALRRPRCAPGSSPCMAGCSTEPACSTCAPQPGALATVQAAPRRPAFRPTAAGVPQPAPPGSTPRADNGPGISSAWNALRRSEPGVHGSQPDRMRPVPEQSRLAKGTVDRGPRACYRSSPQKVIKPSIRYADGVPCLRMGQGRHRHPHSSRQLPGVVDSSTAAPARSDSRT